MYILRFEHGATQTQTVIGTHSYTKCRVANLMYLRLWREAAPPTGATHCASRSLFAQSPRNTKAKKAGHFPDMHTVTSGLAPAVGPTASQSCFDREEVKSVEGWKTSGSQRESNEWMRYCSSSPVTFPSSILHHIHHCSVSAPKLGGSDPQTRSAAHPLLCSLKAARKSEARSDSSRRRGSSQAPASMSAETRRLLSERRQRMHSLNAETRDRDGSQKYRVPLIL